MRNEKAKGSLERPWLASAIAATAGYFVFPVLWICISQILEASPIKESAITWWSDFFQALLGAFIGALLGLVFVVGLIMWLLAFVMARLVLFIIHLIGIHHWTLFVILGLIEGAIVGHLFARIVFWPQYEQYLSIIVAGMLTGGIVGWASSRNICFSRG
jgi:hypothetical protein